MVNALRSFRQSLRTCVLLASLTLIGAWCLSPLLYARQESDEKAELSPVVRRLLTDPLLSDQQRRKLQLFHGQYESLSNPSAGEQAAMALAQFDLHHPSLSDEQTPALLRAEAALLRGEPERTLEWLQQDDSSAAVLLRARALEDLGRVPEAVRLMQPLRDALQRAPQTDAATLVDSARAMAMLARLEGRPAQDYHLIMRLLAKAHNEIDRLYWPAYQLEAEVLAQKHNMTEAMQSLGDALALNPASSESWFLAGSLAADVFDFTRASGCVEKLRSIHPDHPLAALLQARIALKQKDLRSARSAVESVLVHHPAHRTALATLVAVEALSGNAQGRQTALDELERLCPGQALGYAMAGDFLSSARQYSESETMLREAIRRSPNWAQPRIELGLMLMQAGKEQQAMIELRRAVEIDPFNVRANNQLRLAEALLGYETLETANFRIRHAKGIDAVLARDMAEQLEDIHAAVTGAFEFRPVNKTSIEIMPDSAFFAVRIIGLPEIWTVAACTGDVIALTPPRDGPQQMGPYNWARVLQHEFTHTVTLNLTQYRIPHWLTEAAAVAQEPGGRDYETCQLLASAYHSKSLFPLDQINWGFIRPKTPRDRPLAYAQANWMYEFITEQHGHEAMLKLMRLYRDGASELDALRQITGQSADQFTAAFLEWAGKQVTSWGLGKQPEDAKITSVLRQGEKAPKRSLDEALKLRPDHPDLLLLAAKWSMKHDPAAVAKQAVMRYAAVRPVDTWADEALLELAVARDQPEEAISSLEQLDRKSVKEGGYAYQLAQVHRKAGRLAEASDAIRRALHRMPYNAQYRELAAAIELQRSEPERALTHIVALTMLEPEHAKHQIRLAALYKKLGKPKEADQAARQALKLDPAAKVEAFLSPQ